MNVGKTLFAQIMEFVPWTSFARIVQRYDGNAGVRTLTCAEQLRAMAFAQLTWRESLRDIEASLAANASKLYAMGFRSPVKRSTLADANESRDWRIWSDLAAVLIRRARKLYASDALDVGLDNTVYALDSSTVDLCLSLFDWAPFRSTKAAIKLHTLLDLRGAIPAFIHISDGKLHDVNVLDMLTFEAGAFYVMDRGYVDFERLYALHQAGAFFVTRAKSPMDARRVYSTPTERDTGVICDQRVMLNGYYSARKSAAHSLQGPGVWQNAGLSDQQHDAASVDDCRALQEPMAGGIVFQMDQAALAHQEIPGHQRERGEDANLVRRVHLRVDRHRQEGASTECLALHMSTDLVGVRIRENRDFMRLAGRRLCVRPAYQRYPVEFVQYLTGQQCGKVKIHYKNNSC